MWLAFVWWLWYGQFAFLNCLVSWSLGIEGFSNPFTDSIIFSNGFVSVPAWLYLITGFFIDYLLFLAIKHLVCKKQDTKLLDDIL